MPQHPSVGMLPLDDEDAPASAGELLVVSPHPTVWAPTPSIPMPPRTMMRKRRSRSLTTSPCPSHTSDASRFVPRGERPFRAFGTLQVSHDGPRHDARCRGEQPCHEPVGPPFDDSVMAGSGREPPVLRLPSGSRRLREVLPAPGSAIDKRVRVVGPYRLRELLFDLLRL